MQVQVRIHQKCCRDHKRQVHSVDAQDAHLIDSAPPGVSMITYTSLKFINITSQNTIQ